MEGIEPQAAGRVGQLIFVFARLDFLLSLALRNLLSTTDPECIAPLVERLGFKAKMDVLRDIVPKVFASHPSAATEYDAWYQRADRLRVTRNAFVHGRWGMQNRDTVFNAATGTGTTFSGMAKVFSLAELEVEVSTATETLNKLHEWHAKYVVDAV
ncbi:MAG: hypothetical protein IPJ21_20125 [Sterolibacteriaceae bacterium]|nr:hypothetical protein [Sterolibacteriaceae bacterium]